MSLPFTKSKHQHGDEKAVSTEVQGRGWGRRYWGIELGFKVKICKITRNGNVRPQLQAQARSAGMELALDDSPSTDPEETTIKTYSIYCLTPPTDPPDHP